ncbi:hypothetical protein JCM6882_002185 [Rhodosporidiobolus microsporus]
MADPRTRRKGKKGERSQTPTWDQLVRKSNAPSAAQQSSSTAQPSSQSPSVLAALHNQAFRRAAEAPRPLSPPRRRPSSQRPPLRRSQILDASLDDVRRYEPHSPSSSSGEEDDEGELEVSSHLDRSHHRTRDPRRHSPVREGVNRQRTQSWERVPGRHEGGGGEGHHAPNGASEYGYQSPLGKEEFSDVDSDQSREEENRPRAERKSRFWPRGRRE